MTSTTKSHLVIIIAGCTLATLSLMLGHLLSSLVSNKNIKGTDKLSKSEKMGNQEGSPPLSLESSRCPNVSLGNNVNNNN